MADVATSRGRVAGLVQQDAHVFRGLPFARPPRGALRFRPPLPVEPWSGVRDATHFPAAAPQNTGTAALAALFEDRAAGISEDCLRLNLWTPGLDDARRPVLVWIHGGRFLRGSASEALFDATRLARRGDVVVVAIQYRLGPFGFLHLNGAGPGASNLGLRDQIAALEWIRDEIARFGGDPGNVTLFGQSAGAISAGALVCSPRARGLFHRAILQSGPPVGLEPAVARPVAESLLRGVGITDPSDLEGAPMESLLGTEAACCASPGSRPLGLPYMPVIDGDLLPCDPFESLQRGLGSNVPLLVGTTRDEMTASLLLDPETQTLDGDGLRRRCEALLPDPTAVDGTIETYRRARAARGEAVQPRDLWFAVLGDRHVRHPSMRLAELNAAAEPRTFAYRFDWVSPFLEGSLGACHSLDIPFVFGTLADPPLSVFAGAGPEAEDLADFMQDAWIRFARTGTPGDGWPAYDASRRSTMILAARRRVEESPCEVERRWWDRVLDVDAARRLL